MVLIGEKMDAKAKIAKIKNKSKMTIHVRIFLVVITVAIIINLAGLTVGAVFLTQSIRSTIEDDMLVAVDIADQYIIREIELLTMKNNLSVYLLGFSLRQFQVHYSAFSLPCWIRLMGKHYHNHKLALSHLPG